MKSIFERGSVHGRFQPFHNGHLEYVLGAAERCQRLYVGVTQYESERLVNTSDLAPHRSLHSDNPLTFFERCECIRLALQDAGLSADRYTMAPFPIESPELLPQFLPVSVPIFTTIYDEWNREKVRRLQLHGYRVEVLWERGRKEISGSQVRKAFVDRDPRLTEFLSPSVAKYLDDLNVASRLKSSS